MTTTPSQPGEARASTLWIMLLTLAGLAVTVLLACARRSPHLRRWR